MSRLPETTRIGRALDIIWRVSVAPGYWTRRRLAELHEVSERTITADLDLIRNTLKFEVRNERGKGYSFDSVPKLPSVSYSIPEALALILAARVGQQFTGIPRQELAAAVARLSSVIPEQLRSMVEEMPVMGDDDRDQHKEQVLQTCGQAIATRRAVNLVYAAASRDGDLTQRRVDPYAVFPYERSWHVVGYCHLREDVRVFKVDRIQSARLLDQPWEPRESFDVVDFLSAGWGIIRGIDAPYEDVLLRVHPPAARWVAEERWHSSQNVDWQDDGTMLFRVRIQVTEEFQRWVLRYGRSVEVIKPGHLRDWLRAEAAAIVALASGEVGAAGR